MTWNVIGIRNFIVGITVKVASDEVAFRKEKTYVNKLNLALVQVCVLSHIFYHLLMELLDPQTRMAPQLAKLHNGARRIF